jgi:hypothetical protein
MEYAYNMVANDEDPGDVLEYSATEKPAWLQVNSSTGRVSGVPSLDDLGFVNITLKVSDGAEEDLQSYTLEVQNYNLPPEIITEPKDTALVAQTYTYGIQATDVENDPLTYFAQTLPDWLNFYPETQVLIGVPGHENNGDNLVVLGVSDQKDTTFQSYVLHVTFTSGIGGQATDHAVRIYPNPVTDRLIIAVEDGHLISQPLIFEVMDLTGKIVMVEKLVNSQTEIGLLGRNLYDGMYFFRISDPARNMIVKTGKVLFKLGNE